MPAQSSPPPSNAPSALGVVDSKESHEYEQWPLGGPSFTLYHWESGKKAKSMTRLDAHVNRF